MSKFDRIGTNGKGTILENTKASAYAEFMERLQNQVLFKLAGNNYIWAPDETFTKTQNLELDSNLDILNKMSNYLIKSAKNNSIYQDNNNFLLVPFYSYKEEKPVNLPIGVINILTGTNGMASGNTLEEAIVQGLSEICERYVMKEVIKKGFSLPDIPEKIYSKYDNINNLITFYKDLGYNLYLKDASLNKKLPVVCLFAVDEKNNIAYLSFGAHPSLPIAIERNLTELAQGVDLSAQNIINGKKLFNFYSNSEFNLMKNNMDYLCNRFSSYGGSFELNDYLINQFIKNKPAYEFSTKAWDNYNIVSNKAILKQFVENISNVTNNDIYIRDVSFLDFPAVQIFIPEMSVINKYDEERVNNENILYFWANYSGISGDYDNPKNLLDALEYRVKMGKAPFYLEISMLPNEYLALLCSILLKDYEKILIYSSIIIDRSTYMHEFNEAGIKRIKIIKDYFEMISNNMEENSINETLNNKYSVQSVNSFISFLNSISFDYIKNMILKYKNKSALIIEENDELKNIISILHQKYIKNLPNQEKLLECFK